MAKHSSVRDYAVHHFHDRRHRLIHYRLSHIPESRLIPVAAHSFFLGAGAGGLFISLIGCGADNVFRHINRHAPRGSVSLDLTKIATDAYHVD